MRTQQQHSRNQSQKNKFNPHHNAMLLTTISTQPLSALRKFKIAKPYEGFRLGQVVYQFDGKTYGVDCENEISVTIAPHQGPFVGLTPDYLEVI